MDFDRWIQEGCIIQLMSPSKANKDLISYLASVPSILPDDTVYKTWDKLYYYDGKCFVSASSKCFNLATSEFGPNTKQALEKCRRASEKMVETLIKNHNSEEENTRPLWNGEDTYLYILGGTVPDIRAIKPNINRNALTEVNYISADFEEVVDRIAKSYKILRD